MPKLNQLLDGAVVYLNVNGKKTKFYKAAYNHYRKKEVVLVGTETECGFDGSGGGFVAVNTGGSSASSYKVYGRDAPYFGGDCDTFLENIFTSMLDPPVQASLVSVPVSTFWIKSFVSPESSSGRKDYPRPGHIYTTSVNPPVVETVSYGRRAFLFGLREICGFSSAQTITVSSYFGSTNWATNSAKAYFPTSDTKIASLLPLTLNTMATNEAYNSGISVRAPIYTRDFLYAQGTYGGSSQSGGSRDCWVSWRCATSTPTSLTNNGSDSALSWASESRLTCVQGSVASVGGESMYPSPYRPTFFGVSLDGEVEVTAADNAEIIAGMGVRAYRKLNGVWKKIIA